MRLIAYLYVLVGLCASAAVEHHHHHHRHHHHHKSLAAQEPAPTEAPAEAAPAAPEKKEEASAEKKEAPAEKKEEAPAEKKEVPAEKKDEAPKAEAPKEAKEAKEAPESEKELEDKMHALEKKLGEEEAKKDAVQGRLLVNGPLPTDFAARFARAVAAATGCDATAVKVLEVRAVDAPPSFVQMTDGQSDIVEVVFEAPKAVVTAVEEQAADPASALATGDLKEFLVAKDDAAAAPEQRGIDIDTQMPYGELEPFGREATGEELTKSAISEGDEMVDQLERAEVAEEKRAVFRALTRLRGAAITSFDGIARAQTGQMDEYNKVHHWRSTHPLHHLAQEEADVSRWAFPKTADF